MCTRKKGLYCNLHCKWYKSDWISVNNNNNNNNNNKQATNTKIINYTQNQSLIKHIHSLLHIIWPSSKRSQLINPPLPLWEGYCKWFGKMSGLPYMVCIHSSEILQSLKSFFALQNTWIIYCQAFNIKYTTTIITTVYSKRIINVQYMSITSHYTVQ